MKRYRTVLTIAGSDSGGGAGIQADIKSISACGCYAASAVTAVTVQNTLGVQQVFGIPPSIVAAQIDAVLSDIGADAVKIGMLHSAEIIGAIREKMLSFGVKNLVVDPVMVSTSGHRLIEENAVETLCTCLLPLARVITPNIPEAEILLGKDIALQAELPRYARELSEKFSTAGGGAVSVLLKAGHLSDDHLTDIFFNAETGETIPLESVRIHTKNTHGTGCTLSSSLAAFIASGLPLNDAVLAAKNYINGAILSGAGYETGRGFGPVNHFWNK